MALTVVILGTIFFIALYGFLFKISTRLSGVDKLNWFEAKKRSQSDENEHHLILSHKKHDE